MRCFYDLDTPITLDRLERGLAVDYIGARGLRDFDLTLSYVGGGALSKLRSMLGSNCGRSALWQCGSQSAFSCRVQRALSRRTLYLGTCAPDRQERLAALFVEPAKRFPDRRFVIGGSMYDDSFPWQQNIFLMSHVPVADHSSFYCSSLLNLNVTRRAMAHNGYCPSGRLFEAAACGATIVTDEWEGLNLFFELGRGDTYRKTI